MTNTNPNNFIVKFFEKNNPILIKIFEISNYSNFQKLHMTLYHFLNHLLNQWILV